MWPKLSAGQRALLLEKLAELEHEQWMEWSKHLNQTENLSEERQKRWKAMWVPYDQLTVAQKENDRIWARKALAIIEEMLEYE